MEICGQIVGLGLFDVMCEKLSFFLEEQINSAIPQWKFLSQEGLSIFLQLFSIVFLKVHFLVLQKLTLIIKIYNFFLIFNLYIIEFSFMAGMSYSQ